MRTLTLYPSELYLYSTIRGRLRMRDAMTPEGEYARTTEWVSRRPRARCTGTGLELGYQAQAVHMY